MYSIYNRLKEISPIELRDNHAYFHKSCYVEYGSLSKRNGAKDAYDRALEKGASSEMKWKPGCPKLTSNKTLIIPESPRTSRSSTIAYDRYFMYYLSRRQRSNSLC